MTPARWLFVLVAVVLLAAHAQAVFIEVKTNFDTVVFNDFSDLFQPSKSIAVMTIVANNPALNGSQMILAYDPDINKKYTFYFPVNSTTIEDAEQWLVIKENLETQTIMFPSGGCVQLASEFYPLVGYDYIPGHTIWPDANCFVVYSGSLNAVVLCVQDSTMVFFRNNAYALHYDRPLDEADLPFPDSEFCSGVKRLDNFETCTDYCNCCIAIASFEEGLPTPNCEEMPGGGLAREAGYCPNK